MRFALLLALACTACAKSGPTTMMYGNVVDHQRHAVKQFNSRETCEITQGMVFEKPLGITQYYACEKTAK